MFAHLSLPTAPAVNAQSCPPVAVDGGSTIAAGATIDGTTQEVTHEMVVPKWTTLRLDAIATVAGECSSYFEQCNPSPCTCVLNSTYPRTINHISMWMDVTTSGALNGQYTVGYVYGLNPNGTTAFYPVLDTQASNSTGPVYETLSIPGTYRFSIRAVLNNGICNGLPEYTSTITFTVFVGDADESVNNGPDADSCPSGIAPPSAVGEPVNVTNGNVFIEQTDYRLPGFGAGLEVTRTYNSKWQRAGIFGYGWSTAFDESITPYGTTLVRLNLADGRAVYLGAAAVGEPFLPKQPVNFPGQVVKKCRQYLHANVQSGRVHQFNASGKIVSFADRNNNTVTLTYDANGNPVTVTDAAGRTLTLAYDSYNKVGSIADSTGTIATYTHASFGRLLSVTYADGSKFTFTIKFGSGITNYITVVKDALNNVVESHTYDAQWRALTSEVAGNGTERYTLNYVSDSETQVTDALGRVTKYFFDKSRGRNLVTRIEGNCSCGGAAVRPGPMMKS